MIAPVINRTNHVEPTQLDPIQKDIVFTESQFSDTRKKIKRTSRAAIPAFKKLKPLAVWTSLISAKTMSSFFEANFQKIYTPTLRLVAFEDLPFAESNLGDEYELIMIGIYEKDSFSKEASRVLKRLARRSSKPLTICYSGNLTSPGAGNWQNLVGELALFRSDLHYSQL
jgi:hypothetical protein